MAECIGQNAMNNSTPFIEDERGILSCSLTMLLSLRWPRKALFVRHVIHKDNAY